MRTFLRSLLVLQGRAGRGPDDVAKIIERAAGHDRIQVHHAHGFAGRVVEHHVVELGVVVGDALGQARRLQDPGHRSAVQGELNLRPGKPGAVGRVRGDGGFQFGKAPRGVVEVWNGVVQSRSRQIGQQLLEPPEGSGRLKGLLRKFHRIVGPGVLEEDISAPIAAVRAAVPRAPVPGRDQCQAAPAIIRLIRDLMADVLRHALDVLHQRRRGLEHLRVNPLQDVSDERATLVEDGAIGVVNMTAAVRAGIEELPVDLELPRDRAQVVAQVAGFRMPLMIVIQLSGYGQETLRRSPSRWIVSYIASMFAVGLTGCNRWHGAQTQRAFS